MLFCCPRCVVFELNTYCTRCVLGVCACVSSESSVCVECVRKCVCVCVCVCPVLFVSRLVLFCNYLGPAAIFRSCVCFTVPVCVSSVVSECVYSVCVFNVFCVCVCVQCGQCVCACVQYVCVSCVLSVLCTCVLCSVCECVCVVCECVSVRIQWESLCLAERV